MKRSSLRQAILLVSLSIAAAALTQGAASAAVHQLVDLGTLSGSSRAFLLTVPEPASFSLLAGAGACVMALRRRRSCRNAATRVSTRRRSMGLFDTPLPSHLEGELMRLIGHCLTVVVLGIVGAASTVRADPRYEITHLQSLGGTVGFANGVNNHGDVVGEASLADGTIKPVLWRNGAVIDLGTLGGSNGKAFDINDSGIIVGRAANSSGRLRPFIFDFDGGGFMQEIPPLIGATPGSNTTDGTAFGINASGIAAGHGRNSAGLFQAFVSHSNQSNQAPCLTNKSEWPR